MIGIIAYRESGKTSNLFDYGLVFVGVLGVVLELDHELFEELVGLESNVPFDYLAGMSEGH
ncbi:MAG: hypothetical protein E4G90_02785 [Gemmatimonadales bacterium]|nr:MAG: hypothetical protein E4G90_02785 [Gemmatimonadales bacterium]